MMNKKEWKDTLAYALKVGDRVITPLGLGTITGKDLPDSACWRWTVCIDEPSPKLVVREARLVHGKERCFFTHELQLPRFEITCHVFDDMAEDDQYTLYASTREEADEIARTEAASNVVPEISAYEEE